MILFLTKQGTLTLIPIWKDLKWSIWSACRRNLGISSKNVTDWMLTFESSVGQWNLWLSKKITLFLNSSKNKSSFCLNSGIWSGCVPRTTREVLFVGRGGVGKRLYGTPGQIEGGSLCLCFPFFMVMYATGQCLSHNTASLVEILNWVAFSHKPSWSASLGNLKTGAFFLSSRGISVLKWFGLHPGTRHFSP